MGIGVFSSVQAISSEVTPLFRTPGFVPLWSVGALNSTGRWLDTLVIAIFVLDRTGSAFTVASMLMLRLLPLAIFGVFGGVLAQQFERWRLLRIASSLLAVQALTLLCLAYLGLLEVWHVGVASFLSGLLWSTDFPVRRTLMSDLAGVARVSRAMSLDILAGSATRIVGPLIGGLLYQQLGIGGALLVSTSLYTVGLLVIILANHRDESHAAEQVHVIDNLRAGWHALSASPILPGILTVTVIFNVWGFPFFSMVPVVAKETLQLNDAATGFLVSVEGLGAFVGAALLSLLVKSQHARLLYSGAVLTYCLFALAFSLSTWVWLAATLLLLVGFVSAAFGSMQSALVLMNAPEGYQRQMMGVLSVCIGTAPIGFLHIGLLADWLGAPLACTVTAIEGSVAMCFVIWRWPQLRALQT